LRGSKTAEQRKRDMATVTRLLNTEDGKKLIEELGALWDVDTLIVDGNSLETGRRIGLRDAYRAIKYMQGMKYDV
jgi:hypothetical protein